MFGFVITFVSCNITFLIYQRLFGPTGNIWELKSVNPRCCFVVNPWIGQLYQHSLPGSSTTSRRSCQSAATITQDKSITVRIPPAADRRIPCHDPIGRWRDLSLNMPRPRAMECGPLLTVPPQYIRTPTTIDGEIPLFTPRYLTFKHMSRLCVSPDPFRFDNADAKNFVFDTWPGMLSAARIGIRHHKRHYASNYTVN